MLPSENKLMYCIVDNDGILDGAHGLAIGATEREAWMRLLDPCDEKGIRLEREDGARVRRCAIMVINP